MPVIEVNGGRLVRWRENDRILQVWAKTYDALMKVSWESLGIMLRDICFVTGLEENISTWVSGESISGLPDSTTKALGRRVELRTLGQGLRVICENPSMV